jgi:hypothetical protein
LQTSAERPNISEMNGSASEFPAAEPGLSLDSDESCRVWEQLRQHPELLGRISQHSGSELSLQQQLRKEYPADLVQAALQHWELRPLALRKFTLGAGLWCDRVGLEQATAEPVARHKAQRFTTAVDDLCCGIGSDTIALARQVPVTAVDRNPLQLWRTRRNAELYGVEANVHTELADVLQRPIDRQRLIHIDPDQRPDGQRRAWRLEDVAPPLPWLQELVSSSRGGAIKLSPASNFGGKFPSAEIELISLNGECKEATVWFGELAGDQPFRATVLPAGASLAGHPLSVAVPITPCDGYLFDPDPAVVRAGLVDLLADQLGLTRLDSAEEYLTGPRCVSSPFVQSFQVCEILPNNPKAIRHAVHAAGLGEIELKARHIPLDADRVRRSLPRSGDSKGTLLWVRLAGKAAVVRAQRLVTAS